MPSTATTGNRESFVLNRQLEFFTESELTKQLGHSRSSWHAVLVAELIDNALDHCEEFGIPPNISVTVRDDSISVTDNGRGIPSTVVTSMLDFDSRTSSRLNYACPTRGAQGNAGKCLFALPYVLDGTSGRVEIDAAGVCHKIVATMDTIARMPVIVHTTETGKVQNGTSITVDLPCTIENHGIARIVSLVGDYALFNRHAEFKLDQFGEQLCWNRSSETIEKWTAKNPDPAHWYDLDSFKNLIASCIQGDRNRVESRTVRDFVRQFAGLKRSDTIATVLNETGLSRFELSSFVTAKGVDHEQAKKLLNTMTAATEAPKAIKLGVIGREHIATVFGGAVEYKRVAGICERGLPFIVEAAFIESDGDERELSTGVNFSVDVRSPAHNDIDRLLSEFMVDEDTAAKVFLHITTPRVQYSNRGKTEIETCSTIDDAVEQALKVVTKLYTAKMKAQERAYSQRQEQAYKSKQCDKISLKDAIFQVMQESLDLVSLNGKIRFDARSHFYRIRPLVQRLSDTELTQKYLDSVVDDWEMINGIIESRTRDPRGFMLEPHTGKQVPLGTKQVEQYAIPLHLYHTIIYVEKKGLLPLFQYGKIGEKYDAAIICAEGCAVRAAQRLMDSAANGHSMKVFVFHDADPAGYGIAKAIGENSGAHKFDFEIIDAGLHLEEALAMGLETETFTRFKRLQKNIAFTKKELELFGGEQRRCLTKKGKEGWQWTGCQRVELNALSADPQRFVDWVESKLVQHGAAKKLVPSGKVIVSKVESLYRESRLQQIREAVTSRLDIDAIVNEIDKALPNPKFTGVSDSLKKWGRLLKPETWTAVCNAISLDKLNDQDSLIQQAIDEVLDRRHGGANNE